MTGPGWRRRITRHHAHPTPTAVPSHVRVITPWCPHCDLPLLDGTHTHHTTGCGIDTDGCHCQPCHGWCCETCKETTGAQDR